MDDRQTVPSIDRRECEIVYTASGILEKLILLCLQRATRTYAVCFLCVIGISQVCIFIVTLIFMWCLPADSAIDSDAVAGGVWIVWYKQKIAYIEIDNASIFSLILFTHRPYCLRTRTRTQTSSAFALMPSNAATTICITLHICMPAPIAHMNFLLRLMLLANAHANSIIVTLT